MSQAARALIDTEALRHNLKTIRQLAPNRKVMAVIKANGYGHGMITVAQALSGADSLAVARVDEAMLLRDAGLGQTVVILEGVFDVDQLGLAARHGFELVIHDRTQLDMVRNWTTPDAFSVWLKIDTGMNRLGFRCEDFPDVLSQINEMKSIRQPVRLMTHLSDADDRDNKKNAEQISRFDELTSGLSGEKSVANSAAAIAWPDSWYDWIRPGIALFGVSPFPGSSGHEHGFRPVMSLHSTVIAICDVAKGESVGYGSRWTATENRRLGVVAIGYGDGYPWHLPDGTPVLINGKRVPLAGRVSMDMTTIDLTDEPEAGIGDSVQLWGPDLPVEEIAGLAETIPYELLCGVTQRVSVEII